jgi:hypothetical protein
MDLPGPLQKARVLAISALVALLVDMHYTSEGQVEGDIIPCVKVQKTFSLRKMNALGTYCCQKCSYNY